MHSTFTVVFDACVLYPALLRNVLLQLATTGLFRARWTHEIHDEWTRNLLKDKPDIPPTKLVQLRRTIDGTVLDCIVTGYEPLIDGLRLPDDGDRHVLAAAIHCNADIIITANVRHFPDETLVPLGVRAKHPDEFVLNLIDLAPSTVCRAVGQVRSRLRSPTLSVGDLLARISAQGLIGTAVRLRDFRPSL